jgi:hypothetical protein
MMEVRMKVISVAELVALADRDSRRGDFRVEHDTSPVRVRGEALGNVIWQGRQWAVTDYGLEARDGTYSIDRRRLRQDLPAWSWPQQMGEKDWVDIEDFTTAWLVGLSVHGIQVSKVDVESAVRHTARKKTNENNAASLPHLLPHCE